MFMPAFVNRILTAAIILGSCGSHAFDQRRHAAPELRKREALPDDASPPLIYVPTYSISMPVDHFNTSDTRVFDDRFFINDTYYKPGGPVIYWDNGEDGFVEQWASRMLAGWNGTISAPLEVAKALNGLVVAMEHRYYGLSHPIALNRTLSGTIFDGLPEGGPAGYRYLTIEQALEDAVYLARSFSRLEFPENSVLSGLNTTSHLGPDQTPWVFIGGSYPGNRAAWSRLRSPDVWYAAWASSAVVQMGPSGTSYYNPIFRAIPKNCSSDIQAVVNAVDGILLGQDETAKMELRRMVYLAQNFMHGFGNQTLADIDHSAARMTDVNVAEALMPLSAFSAAQGGGVHATTQVHCDWMEQFNIAAYHANASEYPQASLEHWTAFLYNPDNATPPPSGIASCTPARDAIAAYLYAAAQDQIYFYDVILPNSYLLLGTNDYAQVGFEDLLSWEWQLLTQLGLLNYANASNPLRLTSTLLNYAWAWNGEGGGIFTSAFPVGSLPAVPDTSYALSFGGWDMAPSNTMFSSGEFDPLRAYTVFSQEEAYGAPMRTATQEVPACGVPPAGKDAFGLVYGGAAHAEDMGYFPGSLRGSEGRPPPLIGAELFVKALKVWLPCFKGIAVDL